MKLQRRSRDRNISVLIETPNGQRSFSTGTNDPVIARQVIAAANVEAVEVMAKANALTRNIVRKLTVGGRITVDEAISEWQLRLKETSGSPHTTHCYSVQVNAWARTMNLLNQRLFDVNETHINKWLNAPAAGKWGTRLFKRNALSSFFKFCCDIKQYLDHNPVKEVFVKPHLMTHEQKERKVRQIITDDEVARIANFLSMRLDFVMHLPAGVRNRDRDIRKYTFFYCALLIGRSTGLRFGDIAALEWASVSADNKVLKVCTDKSNTWVEIPIGDMLANALAMIPRTHSRYCFPAQAATVGTSNRNLSTQFKKILLAVDIHGKSFHCLRHSNATALANQGCRRERIAQMLGHNSTKTTDGYIHKNGQPQPP